ncbi:2-phytyl-1,4-beta-naphthoquinone methyltransferase, chloroplastic [Arenibacter antarcticus]|uniref:Methyltransferase domain-containing protein n=1 Tax=Arenibacter antarcticus TaxID=2040469 RepID=A0ABW5VH06_9FLAO|nr:methyltransferase domain-containing protein [Arenibacter sp. H213]MCM4166385.1 methyltransferase [Arenibacter sp. H213]
MNFIHRCTEREIMDDPNLEVTLLKKVFIDINKVNAMLNGFSITIKAIKKLIQDTPKSSYTIMDLGCGDGHMLRLVANHFKKSGVQLHLVGLDLSSKALGIAREKSANYPNISYLEQNILTMDAKETQCDILLCSLTMHHFKTADIPEFLRQIFPIARMGIVINDLQRSRVSYYLFKMYSIFFIKTCIAKHDGLVSIKSAFTKSDLRAFSQEFPQLSHDLSWKWAFRYLWVIRLK